MSRIYLDNAATSWPKPPGVAEAMTRFLGEQGGSAGRSGHASAAAAQAIVDRARGLVGRLINAEHPDRIALAFNGTDALNTAIHGVLNRGDHVVTTVCEHNSVLRPLRHCEQRLGCELTVVDCDDAGRVSADELLAAVRPDTRLVAMTHASNVTGALQPVEEVGAALRGSETLLLLDAAQTAGGVAIDVQRLGVDLLAASGHKGMLGPTGTGVLYVRPGVEKLISPVRQGGTGAQSDHPYQPTAMPALLECGNANVVGLAGLCAGVEYVLERGVDQIGGHERRLTEAIVAGARGLPGVRLLGPPAAEHRVGVVSLTLEGYDPHELSAVLEVAAAVECRAGLHCAPLVHRRLGCGQGGALRLSPGPFTTAQQIEQFLAALAAVAAG